MDLEGLNHFVLSILNGSLGGSSHLLLALLVSLQRELQRILSLGSNVLVEKIKKSKHSRVFQKAEVSYQEA